MTKHEAIAAQAYIARPVTILALVVLVALVAAFALPVLAVHHHHAPSVAHVVWDFVAFAVLLVVL